MLKRLFDLEARGTAGAPFWTGMVQLVRGNREEAKQPPTQFLAIAPSRWQGKIEMAGRAAVTCCGAWSVCAEATAGEWVTATTGTQ